MQRDWLGEARDTMGFFGGFFDGFRNRAARDAHLRVSSLVDKMTPGSQENTEPPPSLSIRATAVTATISHGIVYLTI
jgi:hypothetical protein